jgi:hypothetical protein
MRIALATGGELKSRTQVFSYIAETLTVNNVTNSHLFHYSHVGCQDVHADIQETGQSVSAIFMSIVESWDGRRDRVPDFNVVL